VTLDAPMPSRTPAPPPATAPVSGALISDDEDGSDAGLDAAPSPGLGFPDANAGKSRAATSTSVSANSTSVSANGVAAHGIVSHGISNGGTAVAAVTSGILRIGRPSVQQMVEEYGARGAAYPVTLDVGGVTYRAAATTHRAHSTFFRQVLDERPVLDEAPLFLDVDPAAFAVLLRCMRLGGRPAGLLPSAATEPELFAAVLLTAEALGVDAITSFVKVSGWPHLERGGTTLGLTINPPAAVDVDAATVAGFDHHYGSLGAALEAPEFRSCVGLRSSLGGL